MKRKPSLFFRILYWILQLSWGLVQNLAGFFVWAFLMLKNPKRPVRGFHGAVLTQWSRPYSCGLGAFIFFGHKRSREANEVLVHEYGHTLQSALLGPFFLLIVGLPSFLWAFLPRCERLRREKHRPYAAFFCESWASRWGEKLLQEPAAWS